VRRIALLAFLAFLVLPSCGGEDDPARTPAGAAQVELMEDLYNGRFGQAYADLHPSHQTIVSRSLFEKCARETIPVGSLDSIEILDVFDDETTGLLLGGERTKGVRIRLTFKDGQSTEPFVNHEVKVDDRWRWLLNQRAIDAYEAGRCLSS
jgi:hypothetical protein